MADHDRGGVASAPYYKPGVKEAIDASSPHSDASLAMAEGDIDTLAQVLGSGRRHTYEKELEKKGVERDDPRYHNSFNYALAYLLDHRPFYGFMFSDIVRRETFDIPTLCVTVRNARIEMWYNPDFLALHGLMHNVGFLQHEMGHVIHGHLALFDKVPKEVTSDPLFGLAIDLAVDTLVQDEKDQPDWVLLPSRLRIPNEDVPEDQWPSFPERATWETYFKLLRDMREQHPEQFKKQVVVVMGGRPDGSDSLTRDEHGPWSESDPREIMDEVVRQTVRAAYNKAETASTKMHGYMNSALINRIQELMRTKSVPFERVFRAFVGTHVKVGKRASMIKLSRRRRLPPGRTFERNLRVLWAQDDSGSVPPEARALCRSELWHANQDSNTTILFQRFTVDLAGPLLNLDEVNFKEVQKEYDGGTSFQDVCDLADDLGVDLLLIATDGYAPTPRKPRTPVGWILTSDGKPHPWGMTIRMPTVAEIKLGHKAAIERWM